MSRNGVCAFSSSAYSVGFIDVVKTLLNTGADVSLPNTLGDTALHLAAWNGRSNIVDILLEYGADPRSENNEGWTPLFCASRFGHIEDLKKLIDAGGDVSHQDEDDGTLLHLAARYGHLDVVELLLRKGTNTEVGAFENQNFPFVLVAIGGKGINMKTTIDAKSKPNACLEMGHAIFSSVLLL